ncbi:hypothetical protein [Nocardioides sp. AE5]|uniref:hypothetical protein n=1 Tax=Nocardioides sp. AE5 TaxID=2962573 RepID=UPI0028815EFF|nr:hypothetical protein [Nocardioides sp. AE5]MDT0200419.1 hypothetical protein [Nocardioides sp. AE5]
MIQQQTRTCHNCTAGIAAHERFCTRCGTPTPGLGGSTPKRTGTLLASGVLSLITGAVYLLFAIATIAMKDSFLGGMVDDATGILTLMLLIFLAFAAGFIAVGAGACAVKPWAQIGTLVLGGLSLLFFFIVLVSTGEGSVFIPVLWFGLIVGLAVGARTRSAV